VIPKVKREIFVSATKAGNEVVFECADGTFSGIVAMHMGRDQLEIHILCHQKVFEGLGGFVVQPLKFGLETGCTKAGVRSSVSLKNRVSVVIRERDSKDTIAVIVVDNENVIVARAGWRHKFASEIHVGLTSGFHHGSITKVCSVAIVNGWRKSIGVRYLGGWVKGCR